MSHSPDELRKLMIRMRRGDEEAARRLNAYATPALVGCAGLILRDRDRARDAAQSVFLRILSMPVRSLGEIDRPMPWLVTLVRNEARDIAKRNDRAERREHRANTRRFPSGHTPPDGIREAVGDLPDDLAEVVILKHVAGMTFDEIGEALSTSRNTIASRHKQAIARLRAALVESGRQEALEATDAR